MDVNLDKTFFQIFSMSNNIRTPILNYNNNTIKETKAQKYLGITLDQRLTFKNHAADTVERSERRLKILKRLSGSKWGTSKETLTTTYKTYILPVLTFGQELLICASESTRKKLSIVQNKALRIITGGTKSTPIESMEMFTDIKPLKFYCEEAAMKMYERISRTPNSLWNNYRPAENRLKSKISFLDKIKSSYENFGLEFPYKTRKFKTTKKKLNVLKKFASAKQSINEKIKEEIRNHHRTISENKLWENMSTTSIQSKKRKIYVANFRRKTGHDLLYKHLARIGVVASPVCIFCHDSEQTSEHIMQCNRLSDVKSKIEVSAINEEELFADLYWYVRDRQ